MLATLIGLPDVPAFVFRRVLDSGNALSPVGVA
jgi:hypothetical protein